MYFNPFLHIFVKASVLSTEKTKVDEKQKEFFCMSALHNLGRDGYIESTCSCVQARFLGIERNILLPLLWYTQHYLVMYLKPWTYFLKVNAAMSLGSSPYHRGSTQSSDMAWHWWLTSQNVRKQRQLKLKVACSWPFLKVIWARWQLGQYVQWAHKV